jgi:protocatechuate 3,4-dioxygenase beta subunit
VTVRVLDGRGAPLAEAGLATGPRDELLLADALERPVARSGADGRVRAIVQWPKGKAVADGWSFVIAAKGRVAMTTWYLPALHSNKDAPEVDLGDVVLFDGVTLRGRVVDQRGEGVAGVRVTGDDGVRVQSDVLMRDEPRWKCSSSVRSEARGGFVLPCVPDGGVEVVVRADGYHEQRLFPVGRETPLTLELRASGFVTGRALDAQGKGVVTTLHATYECGASGSVRTQKDGSFRLSVAQPGRLRLRNHPGVDSGVPQLLSPVLDGPREGLELRPATSGATPIGVSIRAVDAATGEQVTAFRAAGLGGHAHMDVPQLLLHLQEDWLTTSNERGCVRLTNQQGTGGTAFVLAPGYAAALAPVTPEKDGDVTIELAPECSIAGKLIDAAGNPVAGARAWPVAVQPNSFMSYGSVPVIAVVSDAKGTFRIGSLPPGDYVVQALQDGRPVPAPVRAKLAAGTPATELVIRMPAGHTLHGRITGRALSECFVKLEDTATQGGTTWRGGVETGTAMFQGARSARWVRVGADGSYRFEQLAADTYKATLVQRGFSRFSRPLQFELGEVVVKEDCAKDFAGDTQVAGQLAGTVRCDPTLPLERLLVLAVPRNEARDPIGIARFQRTMLAGVSAGGRFSLEVVPGAYELRVVDVGCGVTLHREEGALTIAPGKTARAELDVRARRVPVTFVPGSPDTLMRLSSLSVEAKADQADPMRRMGTPHLFGIRGQDVSLAPDQTSIDLWLPPGEYVVKAQTRAAFLGPGNSFPMLDLANETIVVPEQGPTGIELKVAPPPPVDER